MKKIRFLGAVALASCVMLTGCKNKPEQPSPETPVVDPAIAVAELPISVNLGASLNLDQYVTLTELPSFTIEAAADSADKVKVEGHVITPLVEGTINLVVKSGTLSKTCSFTAVSQDRAKIEAYFKDVGREFVVAEYEYDPESEEGFVYSGMVMHTKQYVADLGAGFGFLRFSEDDKDTFMFELSYDPETFEYTGVDEESLEFYSSSYFDLYYNPELDFDFEESVVEYDEEAGCELYVISGQEATFFAEETLFLPNGSLYDDEDNEYPIERIEFTYEEGVEEGEPYSLVTAYVYYADGEELGLWAACDYLVKDDAFSFELLDAFCVEENKPAAIDYWDYFEQGNLGKLFPSPECLFGKSGAISLEYGWVNAQYQPIDTPESTSETYFSYLYSGSVDKLYGENSIWSVKYEYDEETGDIKSAAPTSGKMQVAGEGGTKVYDVYAVDDLETPFYAEADTENASVWADSVPTLGGLRSHDSWAAGSIKSVTEPSETSPSYLFEFASGKTNEIIDAICAFDEEGYLGNLPLIRNIYLQASEGELDVYTMFTGGMSVNLNGTVSINFMLGWTANEAYLISLQIASDAVVEGFNLAEVVAGFEAAATPYLEPAPAEQQA